MTTEVGRCRPEIGATGEAAPAPTPQQDDGMEATTPATQANPLHSCAHDTPGTPPVCAIEAIAVVDAAAVEASTRRPQGLAHNTDTAARVPGEHAPESTTREGAAASTTAPPSKHQRVLDAPTRRVVRGAAQALGVPEACVSSLRGGAPAHEDGVFELSVTADGSGGDGDGAVRRAFALSLRRRQLKSLGRLPLFAMAPQKGASGGDAGLEAVRRGTVYCDLCNNRIRSLPSVSQLAAFSQLRSLDLSLNHLAPLPPALAAAAAAAVRPSGLEAVLAMPELTHLDLSTNMLTALGGSFVAAEDAPAPVEAGAGEEATAVARGGLQAGARQRSGCGAPELPCATWASPTLRTLDVSANRIDTVSAPLSFPRLEVLRVANNQITELGALASLATSLRELHAARNAITSAGARVVQLLPKLEVLDLDENHVEDVAVIAEAVLGAPALTELSLVDNEAARHADYRMLMLRNACITRLDSAPVTPAMRARLAKAFGGADSLEQGVALHAMVNKVTREYRGLIETERHLTQLHVNSIASTSTALAQGFGRFARSMESELSSVVRLLLAGRGHDEGGVDQAGRGLSSSTRMLCALREELAEMARIREAEQARAEALALSKALSNRGGEAAPAGGGDDDEEATRQALRQLAIVKPKLWLRLKREQVLAATEEDAVAPPELIVQPPSQKPDAPPSGMDAAAAAARASAGSAAADAVVQGVEDSLVQGALAALDM